MIKITVNHETKEYQEGITLETVSKDYKEQYSSDIILGMINGKLHELNKTIPGDCEVRFITVKEDAGHKTYVRGMTLVMLKAMYSQVGRENLKKVCVEYSLSNGIYCEIEGNATITEEMLEKVEKKMQQIVEKDIVFEKKSIGTDRKSVV